MSWISRLREQISSPQRLGSRRASYEEADSQCLADLRETLHMLVAENRSDHAQRLRLRLTCAASVQSLWFMRSEVMALLAPIHGEAEALHMVELACEPFRDALPEGLRSRPSPLARHAARRGDYDPHAAHRGDYDPHAARRGDYDPLPSRPK